MTTSFYTPDSEAKHIYNLYDGIPLEAVSTFNGKEYFMYIIEWDLEVWKISYMLTEMHESHYHELWHVGVKQYLEKQFQANALYFYEYSMETGETIGEIRLLTAAEKADCFPADEFKVEHDYMEGAR